MKNKLHFFLFAVLMTATTLAKAQLLKDDFAYTAGVPLIQNAVASMENIDPTTGWRTMSNTNSGTNSFNIVSPGLTYTGYQGSGVGNAMKVLDNAGQDIFKSFSPTLPLVCPKNIYISFLINVPAGDKNGQEFIFGIKYSNNATDANYFGRLFITVAGQDVTFGISKSTSPAGDTAKTKYRTNTTYLMVMKYACGGLNGANVTEETGKYDDRVSLFINPVLTQPEPATPTVTYTNVNDRDAYRYGTNNTLIGGLATLYFRTPAVGSIPEATFDGIRVTETWAGITSPVKDIAQTDAFKFHTDQAAKKLNVTLNTEGEFNQYEIYSVTGQLMAHGKMGQSNFSIDINHCPTGLYILNLKGKNVKSVAKFVTY